LILLIKYTEAGSHVHASVFVGPDRNHVSFSGKLVFRNAKDAMEWKYFRENLATGKSRYKLIFEKQVLR
jgi:hypothetical protein